MIIHRDVDCPMNLVTTPTSIRNDKNKTNNEYYRDSKSKIADMTSQVYFYYDLIWFFLIIHGEKLNEIELIDTSIQHSGG